MKNCQDHQQQTLSPLRTELYHTAKLVINYCWNFCSFLLPSSYKIVLLLQVQHCHLVSLPTPWGGHGLWLISAAEDVMKIKKLLY